MDEYAYVINVDGAVVRNGEYLLIERGPAEDHASGALGFPGGKVEAAPGTVDVIERTVARELREEVGIEVGDAEYVLSSSFEADDGTPCLNVLTLCTYESGTAEPKDPAEVAAVHWLSPAAILENPDVPDYTRTYVKRVEAFRRDEQASATRRRPRPPSFSRTSVRGGARPTRRGRRSLARGPRHAPSASIRRGTASRR